LQNSGFFDCQPSTPPDDDRCYIQQNIFQREFRINQENILDTLSEALLDICREHALTPSLRAGSQCSPASHCEGPPDLLVSSAAPLALLRFISLRQIAFSESGCAKHYPFSCDAIILCDLNRRAAQAFAFSHLSVGPFASRHSQSVFEELFFLNFCSECARFALRTDARKGPAPRRSPAGK
jgi:hypothetical protein